MSKVAFPDEIWKEVFGNFIIKTLCRWRRVCKSWKEIIESTLIEEKYQIRRDYPMRITYQPLLRWSKALENQSKKKIVKEECIELKGVSDIRSSCDYETFFILQDKNTLLTRITLNPDQNPQKQIQLITLPKSCEYRFFKGNNHYCIITIQQIGKEITESVYVLGYEENSTPCQIILDSKQFCGDVFITAIPSQSSGLLLQVNCKSTKRKIDSIDNSNQWICWIPKRFIKGEKIELHSRFVIDCSSDFSFIKQTGQDLWCLEEKKLVQYYINNNGIQFSDEYILPDEFNTTDTTATLIVDLYPHEVKLYKTIIEAFGYIWVVFTKKNQMKIWCVSTRKLFIKKFPMDQDMACNPNFFSIGDDLFSVQGCLLDFWSKEGWMTSDTCCHYYIDYAFIDLSKRIFFTSENLFAQSLASTYDNIKHFISSHINFGNNHKNMIQINQSFSDIKLSPMLLGVVYLSKEGISFLDYSKTKKDILLESKDFV